MDLLERFLQQISSAQTRRAYRTDLKRFFGEENVEESDVQAVDPNAVKTLVQAMHRDELSASTQRRRLAGLRRFFDWLIERGVLQHNPARAPQVKPMLPDSEPSDQSFLSKEEVQDLVSTAGENSQTGLRDQALILTIVYGALRRSEAADLEVEDIRPLGRHWIIDLGSTGGYVRIPEIVVSTIERMTDAYGISSGPLWRSLSNRNRSAPMSPDAIYKVVRRTSERAGLDPVSVDTLRQTGLQLALKGGANLRDIQVHGRFTSATTAATLHEQEERSGALSGEAAEKIELDLSDAIREQG